MPPRKLFFYAIYHPSSCDSPNDEAANNPQFQLTASKYVSSQQQSIWMCEKRIVNILIDLSWVPLWFSRLIWFIVYMNLRNLKRMKNTYNIKFKNLIWFQQICVLGFLKMNTTQMLYFRVLRLFIFQSYCYFNIG